MSGEVVLSLIDEMDWVDVQTHAELLGEKLNRYFGFVEAGELVANYPAAQGRSRRIDVIFRHAPPQALLASLEAATGVAASYGCSLTWRVHAV